MSGINNSTTPTEAFYENNKIEVDRRIAFSYGVIGLFALLSNVALCTVLVRNRQMLQRAYNIIIFALAIVDTLTGMTMIVATVLAEVVGSRLGQSSSHGLLTLVQIGYFEFTFGEMSTLLIMCLALERWFAVVRPIQYRYKFRNNRIYLYIFSITITVLAIHIPDMIPPHDFESVKSTSFVVLNFVLTLIFPLLVTWTTYIHLWQHSKKVPTIPQQSNSIKLKRKLVRMCAFTAMFITVCWIPSKLYLIVTTLDATLDVPNITKFCDILAMSNSFVNPWIYYFTNKEYKKAFKRLFKDSVFPIQEMVKCYRSDSRTVTKVQSPKSKDSAFAGRVIYR